MNDEEINNLAQTLGELVSSGQSSKEDATSSPELYPGDLVDNTPALKGDFQTIDFPNPAVLLAFYNEHIRDGLVTLHPWQISTLEELADAKPNQLHPYKYCLRTCNGSGKDAFIITGFCVWFALCKIRSRCILTSASGVQLTSQTESYIRAFCERINKYHGCEIFRVRQRFIKCLLSGSEIRLFATDEAGKAEGYHPFEPGSEMAIIVNEGKSVSEDIHGALRRCTGYNYWLEVSTPGEPFGFFYQAATKWPHLRTITTYDCPHLSKDEVEADKLELGEHSALFRSKHLALFTSLGGDAIIPLELVNACKDYWLELNRNGISYDYPSWHFRIGIDLAAGGDENCVTIIRGTKVICEHPFRETDTEITADRIAQILSDYQISKTHEYIFADDGGVGRSIIDKLVRRGWSIRRVLNQSAAISKRLYSNKGAENWYRTKRIIEERLFDISKLSDETLNQISTRHYKQQGTTGRIALESKKEARADGRPSPDRADAFILCFSDINIDTYLDERKVKIIDDRPKTILHSPQEVLEYYENEVKYNNFKQPTNKLKRIYNSLSATYGNN